MTRGWQEAMQMRVAGEVGVEGVEETVRLGAEAGEDEGLDETATLEVEEVEYDGLWAVSVFLVKGEVVAVAVVVVPVVWL